MAAPAFTGFKPSPEACGERLQKQGRTAFESGLLSDPFSINGSQHPKRPPAGDVVGLCGAQELSV